MSFVYSEFEADCVPLHGTENVFNAIRGMIESLPEGSTYHHFFGFNDQRWKESGLTERARREIVPIKVAKKLQTRALYFPTDWVLQQFGGERAQPEYRHYDLLPEGVEIFSRFYVYGDTVLHIYKDDEEYNGVRITYGNFACLHTSLFEKMKQKPPVAEKSEVVTMILHPPHSLLRPVATLALLEAVYNGFKQIRAEGLAGTYMQEIVSHSRGIEVVIDGMAENRPAGGRFP